MDDSRDHSPSLASAESPPHFNSIVMVSLSDSQDSVPQDVFHTPPEAATDGNDPYTVNHAADIAAGTQGSVDLCDGLGFVDLGKDSELGFSEVQLTQEMGVGECSHGEPRDVVGEIRDGRFDEFAVSDRELSRSGEPPAKKSKLSEVDLGVDSSEGMGLVSEAEKASDCSAKILETVVGNVGLSESEKVAESESSDGAVEGSGTGKKSDVKRVKMNVVDVLRFLTEFSKEEEPNFDNMNLLEVAKACGMTFPRPRWRPEGFEG